MARIVLKLCFFALLPYFAYATKAVYIDDLNYTQLKSLSYDQLDNLKKRDFDKLSGLARDKYKAHYDLYSFILFRAQCKRFLNFKDHFKTPKKNYIECLDRYLDNEEQNREWALMDAKTILKCRDNITCLKAGLFKNSKKKCKEMASRGTQTYEKCIERFITGVLL